MSGIRIQQLLRKIHTFFTVLLINLLCLLIFDLKQVARRALIVDIENGIRLKGLGTVLRIFFIFALEQLFSTYSLRIEVLTKTDEDVRLFLVKLADVTLGIVV